VLRSLPFADDGFSVYTRANAIESATEVLHFHLSN
jgi:hypothetical protein